MVLGGWVRSTNRPTRSISTMLVAERPAFRGKPSRLAGQLQVKVGMEKSTAFSVSELPPNEVISWLRMI